jgi:hypothetical protein
MAYRLPLLQEVAHGEGTWEGINRALRERLRVRLKRDPQPSAAIVDSQSVKSTAVGREDRGYDGGKKVKGTLSIICSWTPRASCSRLRYIARRSWIGTKSRLYCGERMSTSPASNIYGWTLATGARTRATIGCSRPSDGVWISWSTHAVLHQRKRLWHGLSTGGKKA